MKIALLNPPTFDDQKFTREGRCTQKSDFWATLWPPITLAYIAAILENDGHEVALSDCAAEGISIDSARALIGRLQPDLVIWSAATPSIQSDLRFASLVKECAPHSKTAIFGVHPSVFPRECLTASSQLDFIIKGEPELTARELADALARKASCDAIKGLSFRGRDGSVVVNTDRPFIQDLDQLPSPAWHLVKTERYVLPLKGHRFLLVLPSRGCPYACTFCTAQQYYGRTVRRRSVKNVVDEMERNLKDFGISNTFFWSETFTFDKAYVSDLCDEIMRRGLRISWTCNSRVDIVDEAVFRKMARAGCWMVSFGIESASQEVLDAARKGTKVAQARHAVELAKRAGLSVVGHFILGLPGETRASIDDTIQLSKSLGLDFAQYYCAAPFPGSALYETALKEGWVKPDDFTSFAQDAPILGLSTVTVAEVQAGKDRAYREFYYHPYRAMRALRHVNFLSAHNLGRLMRQMARFFTVHT